MKKINLFLVMIIILSSVCFAVNQYTQDYLNPLTYSIADNRYCRLGSCGSSSGGGITEICDNYNCSSNSTQYFRAQTNNPFSRSTPYFTTNDNVHILHLMYAGTDGVDAFDGLMSGADKIKLDSLSQTWKQAEFEQFDLFMNSYWIGGIYFPPLLSPYYWHIWGYDITANESGVINRTNTQFKAPFTIFYTQNYNGAPVESTSKLSIQSDNSVSDVELRNSIGEGTYLGTISKNSVLYNKNGGNFTVSTGTSIGAWSDRFRVRSNGEVIVYNNLSVLSKLYARSPSVFKDWVIVKSLNTSSYGYFGSNITTIGSIGADKASVFNSNLLVRGVLNVTGNFTGNMIYGNLYLRAYGRGSKIPMTTSNKFVDLFSFSYGKSNGLSGLNNKALVSKVTGIYKYDYYVRANATVAVVYSALAINGKSVNSTIDVMSPSSTTILWNWASSGFVQINATQNVSLMMKVNGSTGTASVRDAYLNLLKVG